MSLRESAVRLRVAEGVARAAIACPHCQVVGSWSFFDFHLSEQRMVSVSDVDVFCPVGCSEGESWLDVPPLSGPIRCSRRVERYGRALNLSDSKLIACFLLGPGNDPQMWEYQLAKVALLWLRDTTSERYQDVAERMDTAAVWEALGVKLGERCCFSHEALHLALDKLNAFSWASDAESVATGDREARARAFESLATVARQTVRSTSPEFVEAMVGKAFPT